MGTVAAIADFPIAARFLAFLFAGGHPCDWVTTENYEQITNQKQRCVPLARRLNISINLLSQDNEIYDCDPVKEDLIHAGKKTIGVWHIN
jgi:hypothetical protein